MKERFLRLFGLKRYVQITFEKSWFLMTPAEADEYLANVNPIERRLYKTEDIYMRPVEFEGLEEFAGF